jgi:secreted PhoX family phosphatase
MRQTNIKRRNFLQMGAAGFVLFAARGNRLTADTGPAGGMTSLGQIGPLQPPDANGVMLPPGFKSRIVARSGQKPVATSDYVWHDAPDGGAIYATDDGGWIYVSNSELRDGRGGVGALRFDASGELLDAYSILQGTSVNCAGGKTPWQTWISCEEVDLGQAYECDPFGRKSAEVRPALGTFRHEAVAVDPENEVIYLTEDKPDGGFYRFRPFNPMPDLSEGVLEVAGMREHKGRLYLSWMQLPDPAARVTATRYQVADYAPFRGGEGLVYQAGLVYFSTKHDNRVWCYDVASSELTVVYDIETSANPVLSGVDNLTITPAGDVLVAEDGGDMQIIVLTPDNRVIPLVQIPGHERSEVTGPAFDPSHRRLYFSSQRGAEGSSSHGVTYEISLA